MGNNTHGNKNEDEFVQYLNDKKFDDLNDNMKACIEKLFGDVVLKCRDCKISAWKLNDRQKPDCVVEISGVKKYVSLKVGSGNSVHQESLESFCLFLRKNKLSEKAIETLKRFHYGDGTADGTGKERVSASTFTKQNPSLITKLNQEICTNENLLRNTFERVLFTGRTPKAPRVDLAYHGTITNGSWALRDNIINSLLENRQGGGDVHFSKLSYQPWARDLKQSSRYPDRRHTSQFKWSTMKEDFNSMRDQAGSDGE